MAPGFRFLLRVAFSGLVLLAALSVSHSGQAGVSLAELSERPSNRFSESASDPASASLSNRASRSSSKQPPTERQEDQKRWRETGCTAAGCHRGIEPIRQPDTPMAQALASRGAEAGDADGCVVCHGGDPAASEKSSAHKGAPPKLAQTGGPTRFIDNPASPWVNEETCGQCHMNLVRAQWSSLMMSEAGKIQGTTWGFGALEGYDHVWANYAYENPKDESARFGTDRYRAYMAEKSAAHPNVFVDAHKPVPAAPKRGEIPRTEGEAHQAAFTYIRTECQRCHLGVKGRQQRGDFRGMGCGACHIPYSNEGLYEGGDETLDKRAPGHMLVHSIQGTRGAQVDVGDVTYSGIPVETCTTCHNRGKRIGVSYQGLMESAYGSPYTEGGGGQIGLHGKHYISMQQDVHYQKGMLCQDCHTSGDVHGDRFIAGSNLAAIEIECTDCHGTPSAYPWELPLGYGDENGPGAARGPGRGVAQDLPVGLKRRRVAETNDAGQAPALLGVPEDGFILSARGNPLPDVVRVGDHVVVQTAGGRDLVVEPLKRKKENGTLSVEAQVAMVNIDKHMRTMECYSCHSSWAPQCYGCHIKVDYSQQAEAFDWVAAGRKHQDPAHQYDDGESGYTDVFTPGEVTELRSYLRWEEPALGVNGEGRVSPLIPGCQTSVTVVGEDGSDVVRNHIFRTPAGLEGSGEQGQLGSDMSPVHPHTVGKSRSCESCHASQKALGFGIGGGDLATAWDRGRVVDLQTAGGVVIPGNARTQIEPIPELGRDWSAVLQPGEPGQPAQQVQTVGHHFEGSGPLSQAQRDNMDRSNVCLGCHKSLPAGSPVLAGLHSAAVMLDAVPATNAAHADLLSKVLSTAAWAQMLGAVCAAALLITLVVWGWRRMRTARRSRPGAGA